MLISSFLLLVWASSHGVSAVYRIVTAEADALSTTDISVNEYYFDQLLDHFHPSKGTFKQRYFFNDTLWQGQGSPIILSNPGEQSADGFDVELSSVASLQRAAMLTFGAAGVVLEHRYWGKSSPFQNLTTENMKYLAVDQAIEDTIYFIKHAKLPWTKNVTTSHPDSVPWLELGCSYPGLLSAYTQEKYGDVIAASWASSAPVQAQGDFWQYFEPIEEGMPKNCSADAALAIKAIDNTLLHGNDSAKLELKTSFGLGNLTDADFGQALVSAAYNWQSMSPGSFNASGEDPFFKWCDAMETLPDGTVNMEEKGVGLPLAVTNYAKYFKPTFPDNDCPNQGGACYSTFNYSSSQYTNWTVDNDSDRQWIWLVCTEFGWFQDGDPGNYSSIVSSLVTEEYNLRQCDHMFPKANGQLGDFSPHTRVNNWIYEGWNIRAENLYVVNGQFDPWRSASLSSIWAPMFENISHQAVEVIQNGHHCWDFNLRGARFEPDIKRVVDKGIATLGGWLSQWYQRHRHVKNNMPKTPVDIWAPIFQN